MKKVLLLGVLLSAQSFSYDFIREFEGFSPRAFKDYKQISIGYGTKAKPGQKTITKQEAIKEFNKHIVDYEKFIDRVVTVPINKDMKMALVSLAYNIGVGNFYKSSVLEQLNLENYVSAGVTIGLYNKAGGVKLEGLEKRRSFEQDLYFKGLDALYK